MENFLLLMVMVAVGAIIGGVTNSLAIRMLFRPYKPVMAGKWKLPFTPGLIPKRREELAKQLGRMVVDHLLTAEGLKKKMTEDAFKQQVILWAQKEAVTLLDKQEPVRVLLQEAGFQVEAKQLKHLLAGWSIKKYEDWSDKNRNKEIHQFISEGWQERAIQARTELTDYLQQQLLIYAQSPEAKERIKGLVARYLEGRGFFTNMISSFMGEEELAGKIQSVLVRYADSYDMNKWLKETVGNEISALLNQTVREAEIKIGKETIADGIEGMIENLPADAWLDRSLDKWIGNFRSALLNEIIPKAAETIGRALAARVDLLMEQLHLADIVEREVTAFPISRLERLVLDISKKELRLITWLGVLLGGLIGLLQGLLIVLIN